MSRPLSCLLFALVAILLFAAAGGRRDALAAVTVKAYSFQALPSLGGDAGGGEDVNDQGQVAGSASTASRALHGFLWDPVAGIQDLNPLPGDANSSATAVNNAGVVVGQSNPAPGGQHGVLWEGGTPQNLGTLGGSFVYVGDVNGSGLAVGVASDGTGLDRAVRFSPAVAAYDPNLKVVSAALGVNDAGLAVGLIGDNVATFDGSGAHDLGFAGIAYDVNDAGQMTGILSQPNGSSRAFVAAGGPPQELGSLGGASSWAYALNESGQVVGEAETGAARHAFVYDAARGMRDLNSLVTLPSGNVLTMATGINERGQITGRVQTPNGMRAFLLTPGVDLTLTITGDPSVDPGEVVTYVLRVKNNGPGAAEGVRVTDTLPAGADYVDSDPSQGGIAVQDGEVRWDVGTLAEGAEATLTLLVEAPRTGTSMQNNALATYNAPDTNPANNGAQLTTRIGAPPLPDLVGLWTVIQHTVAGHGHTDPEKLRAILRDANIGNARAGASKVRCLLSKDAKASPDDRVLRTLAVGALPVRTAREVLLDVTLPRGVSATGKRLLAVLDAEKKLTESNEKNNTVASPPIR